MSIPAYSGWIVAICLLFAACSNESGGEQTKKTVAAAEAPATEDAKTLFESRCSACHGSNGRAGIAGASDLQASRLDSNAIFQVIQNGRGNMPAYKAMITENEIKQLVKYVDNLKTK